MLNYFVNCDWGTTRFRLRLSGLIDAETAVEFESDQGVGNSRDELPAARARQFAAVLTDGLQRLAKDNPETGAAPIMISGMASSSIGWHELPYAVAPWQLDGSDLACREIEPVATERSSHRVILVSGTRTATDVMRGEETQAVGLFQLPQAQPFADRAIVVLPGTHSKHLMIENRRVVDFQTFMTGELFDVIGRHSVLRHSIGSRFLDTDELSGEQLASFRSGVVEASRRPLPAALFRVRTRDVLEEAAPIANRAFLSGLLIGSELTHLGGMSTPAAPFCYAPIVPCRLLPHGARRVGPGRARHGSAAARRRAALGPGTSVPATATRAGVRWFPLTVASFKMLGACCFRQPRTACGRSLPHASHPAESDRQFAAIVASRWRVGTTRFGCATASRGCRAGRFQSRRQADPGRKLLQVPRPGRAGVGLAARRDAVAAGRRRFRRGGRPGQVARELAHQGHRAARTRPSPNAAGG